MVDIDDCDWLWREDDYSQEGSATGNRVNVEVALAFPLQLEVQQKDDGSLVMKEKPFKKPQNPQDLEWIEGPLPPVESVPKDCFILLWLVSDYNEEEYESMKRYHSGTNPSLVIPPREEINGKFRRITSAHPWENELNPLKWSDGMPIGYCERVAWYAWVEKGTINE